MQVQLDLAGLGLSFTRPTQEVFYVSLSGILARATTSKVRHTLELEIRSIQAIIPCPSCPDTESFLFSVAALEHVAPQMRISGSRGHGDSGMLVTGTVHHRILLPRITPGLGTMQAAKLGGPCANRWTIRTGKRSTLWCWQCRRRPQAST